MFVTPGSRSGPGFYCPKWNVVGPTTIVSRVAAQSIPNNVFWTNISWDTIIRDDVGAFNFGNPTALTPPIWAKMARFQFYAVWQNATGNVRSITLDFNLLGGPQEYWSENESLAQVTTGWVPINANSDGKVFVFQNDGAARNFSGVGVLASPATLMAEWSPN